MAKILLAEDSATQAIEIRLLLEEAGHTVLHVGNGQHALGALNEHTIDVVVTDLEMPELNGLELVEAMKLNFEHIPAILITAAGSEDLAAQALRTGASSYVPKHQLKNLLNDTIVDVLGVIRTDASFAKLISKLQKNSFEFDLPNDADLILPLIGLLMQVAAGMQVLSGIELTRFATAIEHALLNAMYRGNLELGPSVTPATRAIIYDDETTNLIETRKTSEPYQGRKVRVEASASREEIRVLIRDEGKGFNTSKLPKIGDSPTQDRQSGRGLVLMQSFTDELMFNATGNEVVLIKRCES